MDVNTHTHTHTNVFYLRRQKMLLLRDWLSLKMKYDEKTFTTFEEIILTFLEDIKRDKGYPSEQHSLIKMDIFKGQDNDTLRELYGEKNCVLIILHNITNKFQP